MEATSDMKIPSTSIVPRTPTPVKQKFLVQESFASSPIICQALMAGKNPCSASVLSQSLLDNPSKNRLSIPSVSPSFFKEEHETQRALMSLPISEKECQRTRGSIRLNNRQPHSPSHIHSNQDSYSSGEDDSASISKSSSKNRSSFDLSPNLRRGSDGSDVKDYRSPTPPALRHKHPFKPRDFFGNKLYHESYTTCIFEKELLRHQETHNCKSPSKLRDSSPLERTSNSSLQQCIQDDRDYSVLRSTSSVNNHAFPGNVIESHPLKQTTTAPLSVRSPFQSHHHQKDFSSQVNRSISVSSRHSSDAIIGDVMHAGLKRGRGRPPRHSVDDDFGMRIASEKNHYIDEICQESINNLNAMKEGRTMSPGSSMILSQTDPSDFMIKRIRVSSDGSTASIRGRRPKLTSSREVHGKNKCPHCPQVYYSTQAMNDHINNVHSKNATKYHCKQCSKEFSWKISLNKHLRKQHGHHLPESLSQKHRLSSSMRSLGSPKNGSPVSFAISPSNDWTTTGAISFSVKSNESNCNNWSKSIIFTMNVYV